MPGIKINKRTPPGKKVVASDSTKSPRYALDLKMKKNYPGKNIEQLDEHNKPTAPGVPDTPAETALRRGNKPSMKGGRRITVSAYTKPKK